MLSRVHALALTAVTILCFQNCAPSMKFAESDSTSLPSTDSKCSDEISKVTVPVKILFVIDKSGSNASTDPSLNLRGEAMQNFFDDKKSLANFSWGLLLFNNSQARSLIGSTSSNYFSSNQATMQNAIDAFYSAADTGGTPYRAALQLATSAIANDSSYTTTTKYFVVFVSDGVPDPAVSDTALAQDINNLMAAHSGQVALSTVYYGTANADAVTRLQKMATWGGGKYLNAFSNGMGTFEVNDVVVIPGANCN